MRQQSPPDLVDPALTPAGAGPSAGQVAQAARDEAPPAVMMPPSSRDAGRAEEHSTSLPPASQLVPPADAVGTAAPAEAAVASVGSAEAQAGLAPRAPLGKPTWEVKNVTTKSWQVHLSDKLWDLADVPRDPKLPKWMVPRMGPVSLNYTALVEGWRQNISRHIMESLSPCNVTAESFNETVNVSSEVSVEDEGEEANESDLAEAIQNASLNAAAYFVAQAQHGFKDVPGAVVTSSLYGNFTQGIQSGAPVPADNPAAAQLWAPRSSGVKPGPCTTRFLCQLTR